MASSWSQGNLIYPTQHLPASSNQMWDRPAQSTPIFIAARANGPEMWARRGNRSSIFIDARAIGPEMWARSSKSNVPMCPCCTTKETGSTGGSNGSETSASASERSGSTPPPSIGNMIPPTSGTTTPSSSVSGAATGTDIRRVHSDLEVIIRKNFHKMKKVASRLSLRKLD